MTQKVLVIDVNDTTEKHQQLLDGPPQTLGMRSGRLCLQPDQACSQHSTHENEEMLVFLTGQGQALIGTDQTPKDVAQGKILYIPPNTIHSIKNTAKAPLTYIYCVVPVKSE